MERAESERRIAGCILDTIEDWPADQSPWGAPGEKVGEGATPTRVEGRKARRQKWISRKERKQQKKLKLEGKMHEAFRASLEARDDKGLNLDVH